MMDHRTVDEYNSVPNLFIPPNSTGINRAEASQERCQKLNPMVSVRVDKDEVSVKEDEWFAGFDVVVVTESSLTQLYRINSACRDHNVMFYAGDVFGFLGYLFADLMGLEYASEVQVSSLTESGEPPSKKTKPNDSEKKIVKRELIYSTLRDAMDVDWGGEIYCKRVKRANPTYFIIRVVQKLEREKGRRPSIMTAEEDKSELLRLREIVLKDLSVPVSKVDDFAEFAELVFGALSPVCAIVGGVLSQEVIKAVSKRDPPINNFFFYNAQTGAGMVECIGD